MYLGCLNFSIFFDFLTNFHQFSTDRSKLQQEDIDDVKSGKSLNLRTTKEKINFLMLNNDKENIYEATVPEQNSDQEIVSLIDEDNISNPIKDADKLSQKSHQIWRRKKYAKEEHHLKRVWMSRTSSQASSLASFKASNRSLNSAKNDKKKKKMAQFKSPFRKPLGPSRNQPALQKHSSMLSSTKSEFSSQGSAGGGSLFNCSGQNLNKELNTNQIIRIKKEGAGNGGEMPGLRKRVCRKVYGILYKEFQKPKSFSKKLTLALEYRINLFYPYQKPSYMRTVKSLFKKLRVSFFAFERGRETKSLFG